MTIVEQELNHSIKYSSLRSLMTKSTRSKKISLVTSSSIETDMILLMKTKETWRMHLKKELEVLLNLIKMSSKNTEISILRRCLRMQLSSKNCRPKRTKKKETSKKQSKKLLKLITRRSIKSWTSIELWWKAKSLKLNNFKKKLKDTLKITPKFWNKSMKMPKMKNKILKPTMPKTSSKSMRCHSNPKPNFNWLTTSCLNWVLKLINWRDRLLLRTNNLSNKEMTRKIFKKRSRRRILKSWKEMH